MPPGSYPMSNKAEEVPSLLSELFDHEFKHIARPSAWLALVNCPPVDIANCRVLALLLGAWRPEHGDTRLVPRIAFHQIGDIICSYHIAALEYSVAFTGIRDGIRAGIQDAVRPTGTSLQAAVDQSCMHLAFGR